MAVTPLGRIVLMFILMVGSASDPIIHTQVINVLLSQCHPLRILSFPHALTMGDALRKAGGLNITFIPMLVVYLLQSQFTLQVRSRLFYF